MSMFFFKKKKKSHEYDVLHMFVYFTIIDRRSAYAHATGCTVEHFISFDSTELDASMLVPGWPHAKTYASHNQHDL